MTIAALLAAVLLVGLLPAGALAADPVAVDDDFPVTEDLVAALDVLGNDTPGDAVITAVTQGNRGAVSIGSGGLNIVYDPNTNANGTDTFTYTLDDGVGTPSTATVEVTITPVQDDPIAAADSKTLLEDATATAINVLGNDTDPDGDDLTITDAAGGTKGAIVITEDGTGLTYTPDPNINGSDSFTYTVDDGHGNADTASVTVTITPVDDAPVASTDTLTVSEDAPPTAVSVLANDTDIEFDALTITDTTNGSKGVVDITNGGTGLTYDPNASSNGPDTDSFTYTIDDGHGGTDIGTVNVTISAANDAPTANIDAKTVGEDAGPTAVSVLGNDTDPDGDDLTIIARTNGTKGAVAITGGGAGLTYDPNPNANGSDTFTYTISDGHGGTDGGTVNVTITPANDGPVAADDPISVSRNAPATAAHVLGNDSDLDGDTLTVTNATDPAKGTVVILGGGSDVTYKPDASATGADSFSYTISDGHGGTASATVTVSIATGSVPAAGADARTITEDAGPTSIAVLANDSDVDGDTLTLTAKTNGTKGVVTLTGPTTLTYRPNANANGPDAFTYTVDDGHGGFAVGHVTITITPVNDVPNAVNDTSLKVPESAGATALAVKSNDTDADGDALTITARTNGAHGTVAITGGGSGLTYNPNQLYVGTDVFTYTISDGHGGSDKATVLLTVVRDTVKPVVTAPAERFFGQAVGSSTSKARITWSGTDAGGTGIATYKLQVSVNGGRYTTVSLPKATSTSTDRALTNGKSYRYRARATDREGNVGAFVYGPILHTSRLQNTSSSVAYVGAWSSTKKTPSALGGSHRYASSGSARASITTTMRDVAWVTTKTSNSGSAHVLVDGTVVATINLHARSTSYRKLVFQRHFSTAGSHRIEIRPIGNGRVYLDAFLIYR